jgi:hypothetical protein
MASVDSAEAIVTAPAQSRFFAGFGFSYPFYRPYPVFYCPYLLPPRHRRSMSRRGSPIRAAAGRLR